MSRWTYVYGMIAVDTFSRSDAETLYITHTVVNHLPIVDGSEGGLHYYINLYDGLKDFANFDEFGRHTNIKDVCEWQTKAVITITGSLRDMGIHETTKQVVRMLSRLSSRLWVRCCILSITGDRGEDITIKNPEWLMDRDVGDWTEKIRHE